MALLEHRMPGQVDHHLSGLQPLIEHFRVEQFDLGQRRQSGLPGSSLTEATGLQTIDPGPDQYLDFSEYGYEVWQLQGANPEVPYILPINYSTLNGVPEPPTIVLLILGIVSLGHQCFRKTKVA